MWKDEPIAMLVYDFWAFFENLENPDEDLHDLHLSI